MVVLYYLLLFQKVMYKWCIFDLLSVAYISGKATQLEGSMIWFDNFTVNHNLQFLSAYVCDVKGMNPKMQNFFLSNQRISNIIFYRTMFFLYCESTFLKQDTPRMENLTAATVNISYFPNGRK